MIDELQSLIVKTVLAVFVIVGVVLGLRYLSADMWTTMSGPAVLTDPAMEVLSGSGPPEFKGLAASVTPFIKVDVAFQLARSAGYYCSGPSEAERARLSRLTGQYTFFCPSSDEGFKPGDRALLLHVGYPRGFVRGMELRNVTDAAAMRPELLAEAPVLVVAKGVEFKGVAALVDFVTDRFNREYHTQCYGQDEIDRPRLEYCSEKRKERARLGLPRWDGKAVEAGRYESAVRVLEGSGFECSPPGPMVPAPASSTTSVEQDSYAVRCTMRTFTGQALVATLQIDARTSRPQAFDLEVGAERQVVPLTGKPVFDAPDVASVMVQWQGGEIEAISLPMDIGSRDKVVTRFADIDAGSQRRIVDAVLGQMGTVLATPNEPTRTPMLQKLDIGAYMLARFGASAVRLAELRAGIRSPAASGGDEDVAPVATVLDLPTPVLASLGLARCSLDMLQSDCLTRFISARPDLRGTLISAVDEVRGTLEDLPESSIARQRVVLLDQQIAAVR